MFPAFCKVFGPIGGQKLGNARNTNKAKSGVSQYHLRQLFHFINVRCNYCLQQSLSYPEFYKNDYSSKSHFIYPWSRINIIIRKKSFSHFVKLVESHGWCSTGPETRIGSICFIGETFPFWLSDQTIFWRWYGRVCINRVDKNIIRDGGSIVLYTVSTVFTVDTVNFFSNSFTLLKYMHACLYILLKG